MLVSSSTWKWLGSVTLAGLLLASSIPALATTEIKTTTIDPSKPVLVTSASTPIMKGTYTQVVRKQMQWIASPVKVVAEEVVASESVNSVPSPSASVTVAQKLTEPKKAEQVVQVQVQVLADQAPKSSIDKPEPVQVAAAPKQQVSRSGSSNLVDNALSLQGVPYVFGGSSTKGFDCSGYTQYVFKGSGSSLPRSSYDQFNAGSSVKRENLQLGDLVFFTTYAKGPSHVGIYIGGGSFVHASNSGVTTTSLSDSYYAGRYLGARRVN
ncbi:C40 family peptidase [Desulfosporosinus burensis]